MSCLTRQEKWGFISLSLCPSVWKWGEPLNEENNLLQCKVMVQFPNLLFKFPYLSIGFPPLVRHHFRNTSEKFRIRPTRIEQTTHTSLAHRTPVFQENKRTEQIGTSSANQAHSWSICHQDSWIQASHHLYHLIWTTRPRTYRQLPRFSPKTEEMVATRRRAITYTIGDRVEVSLCWNDEYRETDTFDASLYACMMTWGPCFRLKLCLMLLSVSPWSALTLHSSFRCFSTSPSARSHRRNRHRHHSTPSRWWRV